MKKSELAEWVVAGILFLAVLLIIATGCSSVPQKLSTDVYYRRDLPFCVDGYGCFEGMTVLPRESTYTFTVAPKGDADIDLMVVTTCHKNKTFEKTSSGWFIFKNKHQFRYVYVPDPIFEGDGDCNLVFQTYEKNQGRHAWAVILFEHPKYQLSYELHCGDSVIPVKGVGGCQEKQGLSQGLVFDEPVMIETQPNCPEIHKKQLDPGSVVSMVQGGSVYEWPIGYKECHYTFRGQDNKLGSLLTVGYHGELVREQ